MRGGTVDVRNGAAAALLAAVLLLSGTAALAEGDTVIDQDSGQQTVDVQVVYDVEETYELSIPTTVDLSHGAQSATITATSMNLEPGHQVDVTVTGGVRDGQVTLAHTTDQGVTTATTVSLSEGGEGIADDEVVATFMGADTNPVAGGTLFFSALPDDLLPGTYEGTVTFKIAITSQ